MFLCDITVLYVTYLSFLSYIVLFNGGWVVFYFNILLVLTRETKENIFYFKYIKIYIFTLLATLKVTSVYTE